MADGFFVEVDTRKLEQIIASLPQGAQDLLAAIGTEMVADIQLSMGTSPPGRTYTRGGVTHVASVAGNPPNPDTGELRASITHTQTGPMERVIHDQTEHGAIQEFGAEEINLAPRPFMRPVFEAWRVRKFGQFVDDFPLIR